nr:flagellar FlbD family protein [Angustibacter aerolatus]
MTRLNGPGFALNPDLIQKAEATPDTVVTLVDGTKYVVAESIDTITERVLTHRASVVALARHMADVADTARDDSEPADEPRAVAPPATPSCPSVPAGATDGSGDDRRRRPRLRGHLRLDDHGGRQPGEHLPAAAAAAGVPRHVRRRHGGRAAEGLHRCARRAEGRLPEEADHGRRDRRGRREGSPSGRAARACWRWSRPSRRSRTPS